jgi:lycopene beta-cyclase
MTSGAPVNDVYDYVVVGGGLAGGLTALAIARHRPEARIALVERDARLGGNHTWSFLLSDLDEDGRRLLAPLVSHQWSSYEVRFPTLSRRLEGGYASILSSDFDAGVRAGVEATGGSVLTGAAAATVDQGMVRLAGDRRLVAPVVIDARDGSGEAASGSAGYQRFVGWEIDVPPGAASVLPTSPLLMDATVEQEDGFRFMYVLPFSSERALVEDTVFSNGATLDLEPSRARIRRYLAARGLTDPKIVREERGVLPMPWAHLPEPSTAPLRIGMSAGWFHPATGYSLAMAARLATVVGRTAPDELPAAVSALWRTHAKQARFARLLNRMLFGAVSPGRRWAIFARFFALPPSTIERFFRLQLTAADRARILCARPSLALSPAVASFADTKEAA